MSAAISPRRCGLTDLDWSVVAIARTEDPRSLTSEGLVIRAVKNFFGLPTVSRLANERLEALRCFCIRAWNSDLIRGPEMRALISAGYSRIDVIEILRHVARRRRSALVIEEDEI